MASAMLPTPAISRKPSANCSDVISRLRAAPRTSAGHGAQKRRSTASRVQRPAGVGAGTPAGIEAGLDLAQQDVAVGHRERPPRQ